MQTWAGRADGTRQGLTLDKHEEPLPKIITRFSFEPALGGSNNSGSGCNQFKGGEYDKHQLQTFF